jgi:hypothetical protein
MPRHWPWSCRPCHQAERLSAGLQTSLGGYFDGYFDDATPATVFSRDVVIVGLIDLDIVMDN